ncbi:hypothetical protein KAR48_11295 [bacterium]|nr:hypothetical protein [bacterium]
MTDRSKTTAHPAPILFIGLTASLWAVADHRGIMSIIWLIILCSIIYHLQPDEFSHFFRRITKLALTLLFVSFLQILFRRSGQPVLVYKTIVLATHDGMLEAGLLWIRFLILFSLATLLPRISLYQFLVLLGKLRIPLQFGLMLTMTLKLIPGVFKEAKLVMFFFRFSGLRFRKLNIHDRFKSVKEIISALLMRSLAYLPDTALALELRGWDQTTGRRLESPLSMKLKDRMWLTGAIFINLLGLWYYSISMNG